MILFTLCIVMLQYCIHAMYTFVGAPCFLVGSTREGHVRPISGSAYRTNQWQKLGSLWQFLATCVPATLKVTFSKDAPGTRSAILCLTISWCHGIGCAWVNNCCPESKLLIFLWQNTGWIINLKEESVNDSHDSILVCRWWLRVHPVPAVPFQGEVI